MKGPGAEKGVKLISRTVSPTPIQDCDWKELQAVQSLWVISQQIEAVKISRTKQVFVENSF